MEQVAKVISDPNSYQPPSSRTLTERILRANQVTLAIGVCLEVTPIPIVFWRFSQVGYKFAQATSFMVRVRDREQGGTNSEILYFAQLYRLEPPPPLRYAHVTGGVFWVNGGPLRRDSRVPHSWLLPQWELYPPLSLSPQWIKASKDALIFYSQGWGWRCQNVFSTLHDSLWHRILNVKWWAGACLSLRYYVLQEIFGAPML